MVRIQLKAIRRQKREGEESAPPQQITARDLAIAMLDPDELYQAAEIAAMVIDPKTEKQAYTKFRIALYNWAYSYKRDITKSAENKESNSNPNKGKVAKVSGRTWQSWLKGSQWNGAVAILSEVCKRDQMDNSKELCFTYWWEEATKAIDREAVLPESVIIATKGHKNCRFFFRKRALIYLASVFFLGFFALFFFKEPPNSKPDSQIYEGKYAAYAKAKIISLDDRPDRLHPDYSLLGWSTPTRAKGPGGLFALVNGAYFPSASL